jgi:hypothetical protein
MIFSFQNRKSRLMTDDSLVKINLLGFFGLEYLLSGNKKSESLWSFKGNRSVGGLVSLDIGYLTGLGLLEHYTGTAK